MRRVIFNQKGGVGKTTITCNLAAISAFEGKSTLVVDLDAQSNSTQYLLGRKCADPDITIARFFKDTLSLNPFGKSQNPSLNDIVHETPFQNLCIIPSHLEIEALQSRLESRYKIYKLREALMNLNKFDQVFIDTPRCSTFLAVPR